MLAYQEVSVTILWQPEMLTLTKRNVIRRDWNTSRITVKCYTDVGESRASGEFQAVCMTLLCWDCGSCFAANGGFRSCHIPGSAANLSCFLWRKPHEHAETQAHERCFARVLLCPGLDIFLRKPEHQGVQWQSDFQSLGEKKTLSLGACSDSSSPLSCASLHHKALTLWISIWFYGNWSSILPSHSLTWATIMVIVVAPFHYQLAILFFLICPQFLVSMLGAWDRVISYYFLIVAVLGLVLTFRSW